MSDGDPHGCFSTLEAAGGVDGRKKMHAPSLASTRSGAAVGMLAFGKVQTTAAACEETYKTIILGGFFGGFHYHYYYY